MSALAAILVALASCGEDGAAPPDGIDESFLDPSVDPCTDFYQFACGAWIREHPIEPGYVRSRYFEGDDRRTLFFRELLEGPVSADPDVEKAQAFHASCIAARPGVTVNLAPVAEQLAAIDAIVNPTGLANVLARLHADGVSALLFAYPDVDRGEPTRRIVTLGSSGWSLPAKDDYRDLTAALPSRYATHIVDLSSRFRSALGTAPGGALDGSAVLAFEGAIAAGSPAAADLLDPRSTYNVVGAEALAAMTPAFDWPAYFAAAGYGTPAEVSLVNPGFLMALQALLTDTPPATLKQYLAWRVFEAQAHAAGRTLIDEEFRFHGAFLLGRTQLPPDWWVCLGATRSVFGFALAKEFVARFVPTDPRPAVVDLFDRVRRAMRDALTAAGWLDEPTRSRALEKLDRLTATVGYPDEWPTTTGLAIGPGTSYLEGWRAVSRWWAARAADRLGAPVIPGQFRTSPDVTNAFYSWSFNDVQLPLGIILDPFFWPERPAALNYGALGSIVAHEITHAFDESGRRFDGAGKLVDWWTDSVEGEFGARAQCLVDQYAAYEPVPGTRIDGRLTLGENLADLGGATLAHAAYRSAPANGTLVSRFSADQHFFLSLAQRSCAVESPPYLQVLLRTDPHAPRRFRVNGTLRNVPAFGAAFQCPEGATLNPTVRCALW